MPNDDGGTLRAERDAYARWLAGLVKAGFAILLATFLLYVAGVVPAGVDPARLPGLWGLPLGDYLAATRAPTGWSWVHRLGEGDVLTLVGVAILNASTIVCYLRVLPIFARAGRRGFVAICVLQVIVLGAAAAGTFTR